MADTYVQEYRGPRTEPVICYVGYWVWPWSFCHRWAHAYHTWGMVSAFSFPRGPRQRKEGCRDEYEKLVGLLAPDLLHLGGSYRGEQHLTYDFLRWLRTQRPVKIVAYHTEGYLRDNMEFVFDLPPLVDILYTGSPSFVKVIEDRTGYHNIRFMTGGTDPEIYYPVEAEKQIDFIYVGHAALTSKTRNTIVNRLAKEFDNMWVVGLWWDDEDGRGSNVKHLVAGAYRKDFNEWCSRAKIALCALPTYHAQLEMYSPYRVVNTMATRTFALTAYSPGLEKMFTRKVHLDWYNNEEELIELAHYWLEHDKEREAVAQRGYKYVLENYTLKQQAGQVLRDVGLLK